MDLGTRLVVVGTSGSGKTTIAARLAALLAVPHVELDAFQHGPNWEQATEAQLRARAAAATTGDGWVVDGNYSAVRDVVWPRATTIVWLDYDRGVVHAARAPALRRARHHEAAAVERQSRAGARMARARPPHPLGLAHARRPAGALRGARRRSLGAVALAFGGAAVAVAARYPLRRASSLRSSSRSSAGTRSPKVS